MLGMSCPGRNGMIRAANKPNVWSEEPGDSGGCRDAYLRHGQTNNSAGTNPRTHEAPGL